MKIISKEIKIYEYSDLLKNENLLKKCHNNWAQNENNIPYVSEENIDGFKNFITELNFSLVNYSLSYSEYGDRADFIDCEFSYYDTFNNKEILYSITDKIKDYNSMFWVDDFLKEFSLKYLKKYNSKTFDLKDFVSELKHKFITNYYKDNQYYYSKESFLEMILCNDYEFTEEGKIV
tara:strand:+ start:239 stop:769 length:531 start_codon:yes stop_codon:yes gene_type:complete